MGLNTASLFLKIAVGFSLLAALFHVIGFATANWRNGPALNEGLWAGCRIGICYEIGSGGSDIFRAIRAMETIGLILILAVLVVSILFLLVDSLRRRSVRSFLILAAIVAVVAITIGLIMYGVDFIGGQIKVGWSMGLTIVGGIFELLAAILFAMDRPR